ncbi:MAG TPA: hypothetical protein VHJ20_12645 [Polyangia bacterium]|nr:hypothetical protein [Polyangia bacterium]
MTLCPRLLPEARAAHPKGRASKAEKADKKAAAAELHADDKSMKRQMQWEDKVMGPDTTRADVARVARAQALAEKASKEREAQAAREAASPPPPQVKASAKRAEVALPSVNDGMGSGAASRNDGDDNGNKRTREISPALSTAEAKAAPAPVKPADDKFIDKLLRDEQETHNKKRSSASDGELDRLLASANTKHASRSDDVDKLIKKADSGPEMPAPRAQSAMPAWMQQPDIPSTPPVALATTTAAPALRPTAKRPANDGVVHVVQGASPPARPTRSASRASASASTWSDPFTNEPALAAREAAVRKQTASKASQSTDWNDPFADKPDQKTTRSAPAAAPAKRGEKAEPTHPAGWKDPFTEDAPAKTRAPVAMRETGRLESARWESTPPRHATASKPAPTADAHQGWGVLKKRAR